MKLLVYWSNQSDVVEVHLQSSEDRVVDLKRRLFQQLKIAQDLQFLTFDKVYLNNEEKLINYGIKENKVVVLTAIEDPILKFAKYNGVQVFLCGVSFGLGHVIVMKIVKMFLTDVSYLAKKIKG